MKITFNGTGASEGFPALFCECEHCRAARTMDQKNFRMRNSCLINESLLVDFSSDTYARCLYGKLDLTKVRNLIITHSHNDHLYPQDLAKIMPPYGKHNRQEPLRIYGNEAVERSLSQICGNPKLAPYLQFIPVHAFETYTIDEYEVTPVLARHDPKENCLLYIIKEGNKTLLYGHDSGYFPEETWSVLKKNRFDAVILDCTSGAEQCPYPSHMGIPDNVLVRERMFSECSADNRTLFILTHFAHTFAPFYERMKELAQEKGFIAAYDGFQIEV